MILHELGAIYIHIPKTAGNFLTVNLFRRYSHDEMYTRSFHQDLQDRFEVHGVLTTHKHMSVRDYQEVLDISKYYIIASCRDPFERLISLYFSPHRWLKATRWLWVRRALEPIGLDKALGITGFLEIEPHFEIHQFVELVRRTATQKDFLQGYERSRGLFVLRQESLASDYEQLSDHFGLPALEIEYGARVNVSKKRISDQQINDARAEVAASRHQDDWAFLEQIEAAQIRASTAT